MIRWTTIGTHDRNARWRAGACDSDMRSFWMILRMRPPMARIRRCIAGTVLLLAGMTAAVAAPATPPPQCDATDMPTPPRGRLDVLARGFNLTGWLDSTPSRPPDMAVLASLRSRGPTPLRLPLMAERLMEAFNSRDAVAREFLELDRAIGALMGLGFAVSLDLHPGDKLGDLHAAAPDKGFELIDALWRSLARRYSVHPED